MKKIIPLLLLVLSIFNSEYSRAQSCAPGESTVIVVLRTDNYGYETNWSLTGSNGFVFETGGIDSIFRNLITYIDTICVPSNSCITFDINDTYGDGICCSYGNGYFTLIVDGDTIGTGGNFTRNQSFSFNCPPGSSCSSPDTVIASTPYTTAFDDHWYVFTPDSNGMYSFTTCNTNTCDTKIWIYQNCNALIDETNAGTIYYDDNSCATGSLQAYVSAALSADTTYYVRIGDANNACSVNVNWTINYDGPIRGCTDPTACNFNPLATVSDTCIYPGSPNCPTGPDLVLREDVLRSSMYVASYNSTDACQVTENCIHGLGNRDLIRFTTHIENNGTQDYFVGNPTNNPGQFNNNNCHGHWHYEGYAEYVLYDVNSNPIPIGFKSGFCVMDLICQHGGTAQYGCSNMGISAGCGDIYDASLDCQWIDITTLPDGDYTFVARVNWDFSPDALGRYETSYTNNWGQVCFNLSRVSGGPQITINPSCPIFTDCNGQPFGSAVPDCNGVCNGNALIGNLNSDTIVDNIDFDLYLTNILNNSLNPANCNDIHRDTVINIFDAALLSQCLNDTNQCNFPSGIVNIFDTAYLSIGAHDFGNNYVDIYMRNPDNKVIAYEFTMSGITIDSVVSLVNHPSDPLWSISNSKVLALSVNDSSVNRSAQAQPLCRVFFSSFNGPQVCIQNIEGIVSDIYQALIPVIEGPCIAPSGIIETQKELRVEVLPNPLKDYTKFRFSNFSENLTIHILDATGRNVKTFSDIRSNELIFNRENLPSGFYFYRIESENTTKTGKLVIE